MVELDVVRATKALPGKEEPGVSCQRNSQKQDEARVSQFFDTPNGRRPMLDQQKNWKLECRGIKFPRIKNRDM